jgi:hypothetical protein
MTTAGEISRAMARERQAELVQAWQAVPGDLILYDGRIVRVTGTAQLAAQLPKDFELTVLDRGNPRRFRTRRSDLVARATAVTGSRTEEQEN